MAKARKRKMGIGKVTTVSTFPPPGMFTKSAEEIAHVMGRKMPRQGTWGLR